jgi:peptidoglycan/LPS O-acetylase OafA/YrhL
MLGLSFARFRRVTSSQSYIPEVDGLRFIAIASVFIYHLAGDVLRHSGPGYAQSLSDNGLFAATQQLNIGVQLFFVLSGFILTTPFAGHYLCGGKAISLRKYLLRRVTRLEPPYVAVLLICLTLKLMGSRGSFQDLMPHFGASLFYLHNFIYDRPSDINIVCWSLEIEIQFYLLAPLLAFLIFRLTNTKWRYALFMALCLSTGVAAWMVQDVSRLKLSLLAQLPYFLAGMFLADMYVARKHVINAGAADALFVISAAAFGFVVAKPANLAIAGPLLIALAYYGALNGLWIKRALAVPIISIIGGMCYSIYLLHNFIIAGAGFMTERLTASWPFTARLAAQSLLLAPLVLVVCGGFFLLIERPCMRPDWPKRLTAKLRGWTVPVTSAPGLETD